MDRSGVMRGALWATAVWNVGGVLQFLLPESIGQLSGLPLPVPHLYTWFIAVVVAGFAGVYAWLARQPEIDHPLVVVAASGKTGLFLVALACWFIGEVPGRTVVLATGDLIFAALFFWWLLAGSNSGGAAQRDAAADGARRRLSAGVGRTPAMPIHEYKARILH